MDRMTGDDDARPMPAERMTVSRTRRQMLVWSARLAAGVVAGRSLAALAASATPVAPREGAPAVDAVASARSDLRRLVVERALATADPWVLMHAVLPLGADARHRGEPVLDFVARGWIESKTVGGKSHPFFPLNIEAHPNHFLQIMYERQVPPARRLPAKAGSVTRADLFEGAKAFFSPATQGDELAWTVSVLSSELRPESDRFQNGEGRAFAVSALVEAELQTAEAGYADTFAAMQGSKPYGRSALQEMACNGTHVIQGVVDAHAHGYRANRLEERVRKLMQAAIFRLGPEMALIDQAIGGAGTPIAKLNADAAKLQLIGHVLEMEGAARRQKLYTPDAGEEERIRGGERELAAIARRLLTTYDLDGLARQVPRAYRVILGDASHALRALEVRGA